jgi:hypothetical protein
MIMHVSGIFASRIEAFVGKKLAKIEALGPDAFVPLVTELIGRFGSILLSMPASFLLGLETRDPLLFARIDAIRSSIVSKGFSRILEAGKRMGKIRPDIDSEIASHIYSGMLRQIMARHGPGPEHAPFEVYMTVIKILFEGVLTPEPKRDFQPESLPRFAVENLWASIRQSEEEP